MLLTELQDRLRRFRAAMDQSNPGWELAAIFSKVNQYYFTGTMQDGMLFILPGGGLQYWVRRSHERATMESPLPNIQPMESFRDAAAGWKSIPDTVYLETEIVPLAAYQRFAKYFPFKQTKPLDLQLASVRAVKSKYELACMEQAGRIHQLVLEEQLPSAFREGMSEADLSGELFSLLLKAGHHGIARFGMFDTEMVLGNICFGESSIHPTYFNGPGGNRGIGAAVPLMGSRERTLKNGDLVFIDIGCGYEGYHTDKTMTYVFGKPPEQHVIETHNRCVEIQDRIAEMLKPGIAPETIYQTVMQGLDEPFRTNFMGYGNRRVKFLGHGIGLTVDEVPVIAEGFKAPLQENMALAVEPKKGMEDIGMVGIENTFIVTADGGRCITGNHRGLMLV